MPKKEKLPMRLFLLAPAIINENGVEEKTLVQSSPKMHPQLEDILFAFPSRFDAMYYFNQIQEKSNNIFNKAFYIPALYTEVLGFSMLLGNKAGMFNIYYAPKNMQLEKEVLAFPQDYNIKTDKFDEESGRRIMNLYNRPKKYDNYIKSVTGSISQGKLVDEVYKKTNDYISHYVGLGAEIDLLEEYKEYFHKYYQKAEHKRLIDILVLFENFMSNIDIALSKSVSNNMRSFLKSLFTNPHRYGVKFTHEYNLGDNMNMPIMVEAVIDVLAIENKLDNYTKDDLIILARMFKEAFPNEFIELLLDVLSNYALDEVIKQ